MSVTLAHLVLQLHPLLDCSNIVSNLHLQDQLDEAKIDAERQHTFKISWENRCRSAINQIVNDPPISSFGLNKVDLAEVGRQQRIFYSFQDTLWLVFCSLRKPTRANAREGAFEDERTTIGRPRHCGVVLSLEDTLKTTK